MESKSWQTNSRENIGLLLHSVIGFDSKMNLVGIERERFSVRVSIRNCHCTLFPNEVNEPRQVVFGATV